MEVGNGCISGILGLDVVFLTMLETAVLLVRLLTFVVADMKTACFEGLVRVDDAVGLTGHSLSIHSISSVVWYM